MLILIYNPMFGVPPGVDLPDIPAGFEFTSDRRLMARADVVVFHVPDLGRFHFRHKRPGQIWVAWYMECPAHYRRLRDARFMRRFDLSISFRQDADVMASYIPDCLIDQTPGPTPETHHRHLACSFISGWHDRSGRNRYLDELARHIEIHRYGRLGNRVIPDDRGASSKLGLAANYRFTIAFENAIADDYVTEKFYDPLLAGSVPIYRGAPNVAQFAPVTDCYIDAAGFSGPADLASYLLQLERDEHAYSHYLNWRDRPFLPAFKALCQKNRGHSFARLCRLLAEK